MLCRILVSLACVLFVGHYVIFTKVFLWKSLGLLEQVRFFAVWYLWCLLLTASVYPRTAMIFPTIHFYCGVNTSNGRRWLVNVTAECAALKWLVVEDGVKFSPGILKSTLVHGLVKSNFDTAELGNVRSFLVGFFCNFSILLLTVNQIQPDIYKNFWDTV